MTWLLVVIGAAAGAPLRYLADRAVQTRHDSVFPWGTFSVNAAGSLVLGVLTGAAQAGTVGSGTMALLGTGLCGALTTYSTFSYESLRLAELGWIFLAVANVTASLLVGLGGVFLGLSLTRDLLG
ncbi:fluoride efflux transporter CrcB [Streptomyces sp. N2-109]|uniref:Fluoride-specific ion channel FluC n=1 Tax=Streptomyces gossypii TaxID=2883101 RepID=A0ABT2JNQ8_9ACTN|nr:fluoride efflux transporter CrcB [Streptomyces gossypii]MCT2589505.1 fluoride efflux transporter CrcB [Streptomyces gossypii]